MQGGGRRAGGEACGGGLPGTLPASPPPPAPLPASLLTTRPLLLTTAPQHPLFTAHSLSFPQEGATRVPWGQGNCLDSCFENEHPGSQVSYGLRFGLDEPHG